MHYRTGPATRIRTRYDWSHPGTAVLGVILKELGDFAMPRGIKVRAESHAGPIDRMW